MLSSFGVTSIFLTGHLLGCVNVYTNTAKNVKEIIAIDMDTEVNGSNEFILSMPVEFDSLI